MDLETPRNQVRCAHYSTHGVNSLGPPSKLLAKQMTALFCPGTSLLIVHRIWFDQSQKDIIRPLVDIDSLGCHAAAAFKTPGLGISQLEKSRKLMTINVGMLRSTSAGAKPRPRAYWELQQGSGMNCPYAGLESVS